MLYTCRLVLNGCGWILVVVIADLLKIHPLEDLLNGIKNQEVFFTVHASVWVRVKLIHLMIDNLRLVYSTKVVNSTYL